MGSLPSPPQPQASPENDYRVFVSFCSRSPESSDSNISNWIECYNPSDNSWHCIGTIPGLAGDHVLKDFAMVTVRGSIYIVGGRVCRKVVTGDGEDAVEVDHEVLPTVWKYDVHHHEWCQCAPLGTPRFNFACTISEDKIYVAGGQCTLASAKGISSAEVYDPALDEWKALPNMDTLRYKCVGVTWQGKIYVVGGFAEREGCDKTEPFRVERSSAEVYHTSTGEWELMLDMWQLDVPPNQIVAVDDRLYSSGDCLNTWKGHIDAYDGQQNIWNIVDGSHSDFSSPFATSDATDEIRPVIRRIYLTMAPIGNQLYFLAGYRLPGELFRFMSTVHVFDTSATGDAWGISEPKEEQRCKELCGHCCVVQVP